MRTAYITSGVLLLGLLQSSCSEKPHFTIRLTNLDDNIETVYVNAALDGPARGASSSSELTFELKSYNAKGSFDFGLSFDVPPSEESSQRTGTVDIALVGGGCVRKIIRTAVQGPTGLGAPTVRELNLQSPDNFEIVPLDSREPCFKIRRPLITAVGRELGGTYGAPDSKLVLYGWGLLKGSQAEALLSPMRPVGLDCSTAVKVCAAWQKTALAQAEGAPVSSTRLPLNATPLNAKVAPLLETVASVLPANIKPALDFLGNAEPSRMASALFPFQITLTTTINGQPSTDCFSEYSTTTPATTKCQN